MLWVYTPESSLDSHPNKSIVSVFPILNKGRLSHITWHFGAIYSTTYALPVYASRHLFPFAPQDSVLSWWLTFAEAFFSSRRSLRASRRTPSAKIGWVYEARFQGEKMNARLVDVPNRYTVVGLYPNRNLLAVGASLTGVLYKQTAHLSMTYEGLFGSGYRSNAVNISLNLQF